MYLHTVDKGVTIVDSYFIFKVLHLIVKIRTHIVQKGDYHGIVSNSRARPVPSSERH